MSSTIFNGKVYVKDTQLADNNDVVVAISSQGEIKETGVLVSDLGGASNLQETLEGGNTATLGIELNTVDDGIKLTDTGDNSSLDTKIGISFNSPKHQNYFIGKNSEGGVFGQSSLDFISGYGSSPIKAMSIVGGAVNVNGLNVDNLLGQINVNSSNISKSTTVRVNSALASNNTVDMPLSSGTLALTSDITTPTLQEVTTQGATTNQAITVTNNITANQFIGTGNDGALSVEIVTARGNLPVIQINDTDAGGANAELRLHSGTYDIDLTTPTQSGQLALNTTSETKTIIGTGDKIIIQGINNFGDENSIYFNNSIGEDFKITNRVYQSGLITKSELKIVNNNGTDKDVITVERNKINISANVLVNGSSVAVIRTIDTSTPQTSATLNSSFPDVEIGTRVVNQDTTERYTYTKITSTTWRRSELMTDI